MHLGGVCKPHLRGGKRSKEPMASKLSLSNLKKTTERKAKRVGRGYGSGKGGHTVGRGAKGQKARGKVPHWFEGGQLPLVRRLPHKRGFKRPFAKALAVFNVSFFERFENGSEISPKSLVKDGFLKKIPGGGVKILGMGKLTKKLKFKGFLYSKAARKKIAEFGGEAE